MHIVERWTRREIRRILSRATLLLAICGTAGSALAVTITISGSDLGNLSFSALTPGTSAGISGSGPGTFVALSSDNSVSTLNNNAGFVAAFRDYGAVIINNGLHLGGATVSLGTLSSLLTQGAAQKISYTQSIIGTDGWSGWQVQLVDPNNSSNTIFINEQLESPPPATNYFGYTSTKSFAALETLNATTTFDSQYCKATPACGSSSLIWPQGAASQPWTQVATVVVDGTALGNWQVSALAIAMGGFANNIPYSAAITSITVPGDAAVPEPSSWALISTGLGLAGVALRRRRAASAA